MARVGVVLVRVAMLPDRYQRFICESFSERLRYLLRDDGQREGI